MRISLNLTTGYISCFSSSFCTDKLTRVADGTRRDYSFRGSDTRVYECSSNQSGIQRRGSFLFFLLIRLPLTCLTHQSDCVKNAWVNWLVWYRKQAISPSVLPDIGAIYQVWIKGVVQDVQGTLQSSIGDLQEWWKNNITLSQTPGAPTEKGDVLVPVRSAHFKTYALNVDSCFMI